MAQGLRSAFQMAEVIQFHCPACDTTLRVPPAAAGFEGPCPRCAQLIVGPDPALGLGARLAGTPLVRPSPESIPAFHGNPARANDPFNPFGSPRRPLGRMPFLPPFKRPLCRLPPNRSRVHCRHPFLNQHHHRLQLHLPSPRPFQLRSLFRNLHLHLLLHLRPSPSPSPLLTQFQNRLQIPSLRPRRLDTPSPSPRPRRHPLRRPPANGCPPSPSNRPHFQRQRRTHPSRLPAEIPHPPKPRFH